MTHTPGPWRVGDAGRTVFGPPNGEPSPEIIADIRLSKYALLIATAPELLKAALELLGNLYDEGESTDEETGEDFTDITALQTAVDKATG